LPLPGSRSWRDVARLRRRRLNELVDRSFAIQERDRIHSRLAVANA
jgi:hypothetical protein